MVTPTRMDSGEPDDAVAVPPRRHLPTELAAVPLDLERATGQAMTRDEALVMEGAHAVGALPDESPLLDR